MAPLASGMKRRHFLKALGTAAVALALPSIAAPVARELHFHPDAIKDAAQSLADAIDREGMRIIMARYTVDPDRQPCRIDILYGWKSVRPELACRVVSS